MDLLYLLSKMFLNIFQNIDYILYKKKTKTPLPFLLFNGKKEGKNLCTLTRERYEFFFPPRSLTWRKQNLFYYFRLEKMMNIFLYYPNICVHMYALLFKYIFRTLKNSQSINWLYQQIMFTFHIHLRSIITCAYYLHVYVLYVWAMIS